MHVLGIPKAHLCAPVDGKSLPQLTCANDGTPMIADDVSANENSKKMCPKNGTLAAPIEKQHKNQKQ